MTDEDKKYLSDILQAIVLIEQFTNNTATFNDYLLDFKTQSAVERQLGIIGEAANKFIKLSPNNVLENSKSIIGFRNRIIHAYDAVDPSIIWVILKKHLPLLKSEVEVKIQ